MLSLKKSNSLLLNKISNFIFPVQCAICKSSDQYLCLACENNLQKHTNFKKKNEKKVYRAGIDLANKTFSKYNYKDKNVKNLLFKIKYNHHPKLGEQLGAYSRDFIKDIILKNNNIKNFIFVPIPISENRQRERGYNQAYHVSIGIDKENTFNILKRIKNTNKLKDSSSLDNRLSEVENSMSVNILELNRILEIKKITEKNEKSYDINFEYLKNNLKIILIDDMTTTGATFYEAKKVLINYGFEKDNVYAFALAH